MDPQLMSGGGDIGSGIGGIIGALIAEALNAGDYDEAERLQRKAAMLYEGLDPRLVSTTEDVIELGPSAMEGVSIDPTTRAMQARVLEELSRRGFEGGMDIGARADLAEGLAAAAQQERAMRGSALQQAAARGMAGSGALLAAQLQGQGGAAARANQAGLRAAADAQARTYQALAQSADLAGALRGQDYQEATDKARAADIIAQYNARNRQDVYGRNLSRDLATQQAQFGQQLARAGGLSGQYGQQADLATGRARRRSQVGYGVGSGLGRGAGMAIGAFAGKGG